MNQTQQAEVKAAYEKQRDDFKKKRDAILSQIKGKLSEISDLEKAIGAARPKTADSAILCPRCDTISMVYEGRTPQGGMSGGDDVYTCNICGHCSLDDYWTGDDLRGVGYDRNAASVLKKS